MENVENAMSKRVTRKITRECMVCGKETTREFDDTEGRFTKGWNAWAGGALIQNAFPFLSPEDREFLMTGMCPECQEQIFREEPEEESEEEELERRTRSLCPRHDAGRTGGQAGGETRRHGQGDGNPPGNRQGPVHPGT